ncbi:MAG: zf-HC2 domain-containing protein [Acidobacteria bacterium]|nr:zf-HC2 domain-containing protein [Acidobacteriota bacterium]
MIENQDLDCATYISRIARKLDAALSESEARELETHLRGCGRCRAELLLQVKLVKGLTQEPPSGLSPQFTLHVSQQALKLDLYPARPWGWADFPPAWAATAVAAVLLLLGAALWPPLAAVFLQPVSWLAEAISSLAGGGSGRAPSLLLATLLAGLCAAWCAWEVCTALRERFARETATRQVCR